MKNNLIETVIIVAVVAATWAWWGTSSGSLELRVAFGYGAAVILGQGLVRDLITLATRGRPTGSQKLTCLCAESTIGLSMLLLGAGGLTLLGVTEHIALDGARLPIAVGTLLLLGLGVKDYAVSIHRIPDHGDVRVL